MVTHNNCKTGAENKCTTGEQVEAEHIRTVFEPLHNQILGLEKHP